MNNTSLFPEYYSSLILICYHDINGKLRQTDKKLRNQGFEKVTEMNSSARMASLTIDLNNAFTGLVLDYAEGCGRSFGFPDDDTMRIRLACEEVFLSLCETEKMNPRITIEAINDYYRMTVKFLFKAHTFDPFAFNLTAQVSVDEEESGNMGLLIASRMVDQFSIHHQQDNSLSLNLIKNKTYPPPSDGDTGDAESLSDFVIKKPDNETMKRFAKKAIRFFGDTQFPAIFRSGARLVDMITQGHYQILVATGKGTKSNETGGGIIWHPVGKAMIQFYGPYLFDQQENTSMAQGLVEGLIGSIAKTEAVGIYSYYTTASLPHDYFEPLGSVEYQMDSGMKETQSFVYRQLKEDPGASMWVHRSLEPFVKDAYARLFLPRQLTAVAFEGEHLPPHSVFSLQFNRGRSSVTIRPTWDGQDFEKNIADHLKLLNKEGLHNVYFELDCGIAWQAKLAPALLNASFAPVLLLPYAGRGDIVVFQRQS
jgi:anti-sigma regulatory factor (Ser/Thr protein kinase)